VVVETSVVDLSDQLDDDLGVDLADFKLFQAAFTAP
jgi:hypothetical protein